MGHIKDNIDRIQAQKSEIAMAVGKKPEDVLLVAVTKTRTPAEINEAIDAGITDIGENKVQEVMDKFDFVKPVRWHLIGHLQTNKVKYIIDRVSMIHSVDSLKLAEEIDKRAAQHDKVMDILIQVNSAAEESKFGITTEETDYMIRQILDQYEHIRICGMMCIAPFAENPEDIRIYFREVRALYEKYSAVNHPRLHLQYLSMGMSHDYPVAIEEGSNLIRVGTAIFGERDYSKTI